MKKDSHTDIEIINGIKNQNSDILLFVYRKNYRAVRYYIEKNSGSDKDAEDVFQDAMILLYNKIREENLELKCSVHTYLFSVVKLLWLGQLKRREIRKTETDDCDTFISENTGILESILQTERKAIFLKHFNELTNDCQRIIAYFLKGFSISEITKVMGYSSEQHTKNRRLRCKKSLLEKIVQNPHYKELANGTIGNDYQVPRW